MEAWYIPSPGSGKLIVSAHAFGFNRAGFPSHLEPWKSAFGEGNDTEIDFTADYKILHDNGYNVLAFDFRNFGLSGDANGGLQSNNRFEARDVIGTLDYIRSRPELASMALGIFARCMGANATFRAIDTDPAAFRNVRCLVAPLLLSTGTFLDTLLQKMGLVGGTSAWLAANEIAAALPPYCSARRSARSKSATASIGSPRNRNARCPPPRSRTRLSCREGMQRVLDRLLLG